MGQPVALFAYDSVIGRFRCTAFIEQITSGRVSSSVQVGRDGVERSWWIPAAGRTESIREHEQSLEVLREVYSELLAGFPKHAQPIRFVDLRIRQCKRLGPFHDRVPTHQFEVVDEVLKDVDAP